MVDGLESSDISGGVGDAPARGGGPVQHGPQQAERAVRFPGSRPVAFTVRRVVWARRRVLLRPLGAGQRGAVRFSAVRVPSTIWRAASLSLMLVLRA